MTKIDPQLLEKYAELTIRVGVNLKEGQRLVIGVTAFGMTGVPVQLAQLVRALTKHAYMAGAKYVNVLWDDQQLDRIRLEYGSAASLDEFPDWRVQSSVAYMEAGDAVLLIYTQDPDLMVGQDPAALEKLHSVAAEKIAPAFAYIANGSINWSAISGSMVGWAKKVFPKLSPEAAEAKLWDTIFEACRVKTDDPILTWQQHIADLEARAAYMNGKATASPKRFAPTSIPMPPASPMPAAARPVSAVPPIPIPIPPKSPPTPPTIEPTVWAGNVDSSFCFV